MNVKSELNYDGPVVANTRQKVNFIAGDPKWTLAERRYRRLATPQKAATSAEKRAKLQAKVDTAHAEALAEYLTIQTQTRHAKLIAYLRQRQQRELDRLNAEYAELCASVKGKRGRRKSRPKEAFNLSYKKGNLEYRYVRLEMRANRLFPALIEALVYDALTVKCQNCGQHHSEIEERFCESCQDFKATHWRMPCRKCQDRGFYFLDEIVVDCTCPKGVQWYAEQQAQEAAEQADRDLNERWSMLYKAV